MSNNQEERELENFNNDIETSLVDAIFGSQNQNKNKNNSPILNNTEVQIELNTDSFVEIPINKTNNNNNQLPIFSPDSVNNFSPTFESTKDTFSNTPNSQSRNNSETSSNSEVDEESEIASNSNFQTSPRSSTEIIRNENKTNSNNNKIEKENKKGKKEKKETKEKDKKDKKEKKKKNRSTISTFISLFPYIWPSKKTSDFATEVRIRVVISFALLFLAKIVSVTLPQFFKYAVDSLTNITPESNFHVPIIYIIIYGVLKMLSTSIVDLRDLVFFKVGQEVTRSICIKTFVHLENLSYRFHTQRKTGTVLRAMDRGTESIANILNVLMFNVLPTILEVVLTCIILISEYKFYFTLVTFGTISFYVVFTLVVTEYRNKYRRLANQKDNEATDKAVESMLNFETVKYFATEVHEKQRYDEALKQFNITGMKAQFSLAVLNFGQSFIIGLGLIAVMAMAAAGVNKGSMTVGDFVLFNAYIIQLYSPLTWLGDAYRTVTKSIVDMENLFDLLDEDIEVKDSPNAKELKVPSGEVEFKNVSFSYDDENQILKDISFKIPAGKTVAIVGSSGSGKTTTSRLLFRFYDIQKGSITIDGQDIRNVTQKSLRENIGIVPQQTELFNETLQYNISYGKIGATEDEVDAAAFRSKIQKLVKKLPEKYNTIVGERGARLSGGEKQRVSIARAMLKNPKIMILDEATSSLDSKTEKEIHHSLKEVCLNRTTLIIAHRLSTIVEADEILVMKHGTIIERGNFEQLTSNPNGVFTEMWQRSQKDKE